MGKKKTNTVENLGEAGDEHSDFRDSIQAATLKQMQTQYKGLDMLSHAETLWRCGGIALPSLCLRYLSHQEAFALGRTLTLSGLFRSNKTSLAFEIMRWVLTYKGIGWYNDVERKDSPGMRESLMGYNQEFLNNIHILPCSMQEHWQSGVTNQFDSVLKMSEKYGGKMRVVGCSVVDSVAAADPKAEQEAFISKHAGAGRRSHPILALYNSKWLTGIVHYVSAGPFILLLIQHSAEVQVEGTTSTTRKQKGGMEVAFAKTTAFEMTRKRDMKETSKGGGAIITIECSKNALGPSKRKIEVPVRWYWEPDPENPGESRQRYFWDWHHCSIQTMLSFEAMPGRKQTWNDIKEVCDLHVASGARVWSRALGIPKESPVKLSTAGEILEYEHPELLPPLYDILHIERRPVLKPGGDVLDLWNGRVAIPAIPDVPPYPRLSLAESEDGDDE